MTILDSIFKSRNITLPTKVRLVKTMVFPVVTYGCESWTLKKAEHRRIDSFELWCWRRLLRVPWPARRSSQSILKEISPGCSMEGVILKLKFQSFGHLMRRADSFEKTLMLGKNITCILLIISNTRSIDQGVVEIYKEWRRCTSEPRELNSSVGWFNTHIDIHIHTYVCISYIIGLDVDVSIF